MTETMPHIREELRQSAFYFHARAEELVNSGERLRAYLVAELQGTAGSPARLSLRPLTQRPPGGDDEQTG